MQIQLEYCSFLNTIDETKMTIILHEYEDFKNKLK